MILERSVQFVSSKPFVFEVMMFQRLELNQAVLAFGAFVYYLWMLPVCYYY